jgi:hypothetical protein
MAFVRESCSSSGMNSKTVGALIFCLIAALPPITLAATDIQPIGKSIPAESIYMMYVANPLNMEKYEKKRHEVHGVVLSVSRTTEGLPCLLLSGGEGALFSVQCVFQKDATSRLQNILPTMHVFVEGELQGKSRHIVFTGCKLLRTI